MKNPITLAVLAALSAAGLSSAQTPAYSQPSGYVTITCPANSDTIVGVPLRQSAALSGALTAAPSQSAGQATLSLNNFTGSYANTHYVKFSTGPDAGKILPVVSNTTTTLVVGLNGDTLTSAQGNTLEVIKFWTLAELFNPALATTDPLTTPNAIVASTSALTAGRRTQILLPDKAATGINLSPTSTFFVFSSQWRKVGTAGDFGTFQLWPDSYMIIRNPSSVTASTKYLATGQVETASISIPLATQSGGQQDNFVALPRPVDATLDSLNLKDTAAFVSSTNSLVSGRKDQLLVFDNATALQNKSPTATYYVLSGQWRKVGSGLNVGTDVIKAGDGFIIRKAATATSQTFFWLNTPSYNLN